MDTTKNISNPIQKLLDNVEKYKNGWEADAKLGGKTINLPQIEVVGGIILEKIRSIFENNPNHARWNIIHRTMNKLIIKYSESDLDLENIIMAENKIELHQKLQLAKKLIETLVKKGYLPNNKVSTITINKIEYCFLKWQIIRKHIDEPSLFYILISEIENTIYGNIDEVYVNALYDTIGEGEELDKDFQIYLACRRSLLGDDVNELFYGLFKKDFPSWETLDDWNDVNLVSVKKICEISLIRIADKQNLEIIKKVRDLSIYIKVLRQVIDNRVAENTPLIFIDNRGVEDEIWSATTRLIKQNNKKIRLRIFITVLFLFLTKSIFIIPAEIALGNHFFGGADMLAIMINLFAPAVLLMLIISENNQQKFKYLEGGLMHIFEFISNWIKKIFRIILIILNEPPIINTELIIGGVKTIIFSDNGNKLLNITTKKKNNRNKVWLMFLYPLTGFLIYIITPYILRYIRVIPIISNFISWVLYLPTYIIAHVKFNPVDTIILLIITAIVSYLGYRMTEDANIYLLQKVAESQPKKMVLTFIALPFIWLGKKINSNVKKYSPFVPIIDVIEDPVSISIKTVSETHSLLMKVFKFTASLIVNAVINIVSLFQKIMNKIIDSIDESKNDI